MVNISSLVGQYPIEKEISLLNLETYKFMCEEKSRIGGFCYINSRHSNCIGVLKKGIETTYHR
jgi:hypothetical protein